MVLLKRALLASRISFISSISLIPSSTSPPPRILISPYALVKKISLSDLKNPTRMVPSCISHNLASEHTRPLVAGSLANSP
jgi:hypothetical protein